MNKLLSARYGNKLTVAVLFFFSGFSGLIYQVLWMRKFKLVLGSSIFSVSIVVASFMIGLLLGSWIVGKGISLNRIRNELKIYGLLEFFIGLYSLLFLSVITHAAPVYGFIYQLGEDFFFLKLFLNAVVTMAVLVLPTIAMGATLPLLVNYYSKQLVNFSSVVSLLYAINTLGGAFAALISGFYLIKILGVNNSILLATGINMAVGAWAFFLSKRAVVFTNESIPEIAPVRRNAEANVSKSGKQMLYVSMLTGFMALSYEVLWVRELNYLLNNSTYTFSLILFIFLLGIAGGSFLYKFLFAFQNKYRLLAYLQFVLCMGALFSVFVFYRFAYSGLFRDLFIGNEVLSAGWYDNVGLNLYMALLIFLIPSLIMGVSFPLISEIYYRENKESPGAAISSVYVYNMLGSILGSLLPIFVMIPALGGVKQTLVSVLLLNLLLALFLMYWSAAKRRIAIIVTMASVFGILFPAFTKGNMLCSLEGLDEEQVTDRVSFYKEGVMATVKVYDKAGRYRSLSIDGVTIGSEMFHAKEKTIAHLPFFTDRKIGSVLVVGLASGTTAGSMLYHPGVQKMQVVEIVPTVIEVADMFKGTNNNLKNSPRVHITCDDITSYLMHTDSVFDLISSDGKFGALNRANTTMLSEDFYGLCAKRLTPQGLFIQWISTEIPGKHFKTILETTRSTFPFSELFLVKKNLFILSSKSPVQIDAGKIKKCLGDSILANELAECYFYSPEEVLSSYCGRIEKGEQDVALNSFDHPGLEYDYNEELARDTKLHASSSLTNLLFLYENFQRNDSVSFNKLMGTDSKRNYAFNKRFIESRIAYIKGHVSYSQNQLEKAYEQFSQVVALDHPDNWNDVAVSSKILAEICIGKTDYKSAVNFCNKAIDLLPDFGDVYTLRGIAKFRMNDRAGAKADLEKALLINAGDQTAVQFLGELNSSAGNQVR